MRTTASVFNRVALRNAGCFVSAVFSAVLMGCSVTPAQQGKSHAENIQAVTASNELITFNAGRPGKILSRKPITGLQGKETIHGIDYRVAKGWLYALGSTGRIYRLDAATGVATMVDNAPLALTPQGSAFGFDFNPTVDRIRIVSDTAQNMRAHPDTGASVDGDANASGIQADGKLAYAKDDRHAGKMPAVSAAAYTYNKDNDKLTTNFAIDAALGALVTQGTVEGKTPAVSPNTGQLFTVGALGTGALSSVSFDIADVSGTAFMAADKTGQSASGWYEIDLKTGKATLIGTVGLKEKLVAVAVEP